MIGIILPTTAFDYAHKDGAGECNAAEDASDDTYCVIEVYCYERDCSCGACNNSWQIQEAPEIFWVYANYARGEGEGELHGRYCFELPVVIPVSGTGRYNLLESTNSRRSIEGFLYTRHCYTRREKVYHTYQE
jgi:hypothetical protein